MTVYPPLAELLPHRAPMILLDRVGEEAVDGIICTVDLKDQSTFMEAGKVPAIVATEYMAQCIAAYAGLKAYRRGDPIRTGYVIGAQRINILVDEFHAGEELQVSVQRVWGDDALGRFECSIRLQGEVVAEGALTVFQGDLPGENPDRPGMP